jgi:alkylation response protein AidB-like acyl-CoA dehydrogenase
MTTYTAPINDVNFVLQHLSNLPVLQKLPGFEEATPDMVAAILEEAAKFAQEELAPLNWTGDQAGVKLVDGNVKSAPGFSAAYQQFVDSGWLGLAQPEKYGGQGLPFSLHMAASEFWNSANMSFALCPMLSASGIDALLAHGSDALKETYLEKMVSGEWTGTMLLTEPQAGSDLAALTTKAERNGDHYLITGNKIFITWGDHDMTDNIAQFILARLPDAPPGVKGISLFLVPKYLVNTDGSLGALNDSKPVSVEHKMGIHASPTCVMSFGDNGGAVGYLVGEENNGLACMFTMMIHARLEVGLEGVGLSERSYQGAVAYALDRKQGKRVGHEGSVAIAEHADVRRMLMLMRCLTEASRAITYVAAAAYDHSKSNPNESEQAYHLSRLELLTPIAKTWPTEIAQEVTSLGVQVLGGMGFIEESGMAQHYRDARIITIYEGTTGIQSNDLIGRKLLRDKAVSMGVAITEMQEIVAQLANVNALSDLASMLQNSIDHLQTAVDYIVNVAQEDVDLAGSVAVNFMMLTGTVFGGWQMCRAALAVTQTATKVSSEMASVEVVSKEFADNKIATTRFYCHHVLPRAAAYLQMIEITSDTIYSISADQL